MRDGRVGRSSAISAGQWGVALSLAVIASVLPAIEAARWRLIAQGDIWSGLRCGLWSLQHHDVPRTGLFTQFPELQWTDSSWGLDLLRAVFYRMAGLAGVEIVQVILLGFLAGSILHLAASVGRSSRLSLLVAALSIAMLAQPDATVAPALFAWELTILLTALEDGPKKLRWLPLLMFVWASVDSSFLVGLGVLIWLPAALLLEQGMRKDRSPRALTPAAVAKIAAVSAAACVISPYGWRVYQPLVWVATGHSYNYIAGLHALAFRKFEDFLVVLWLLGGFFALGRMRMRSLFPWGVLLLAATLSCAVQQFRWTGIVAVCAVGAMWLRAEMPFREVTPWRTAGLMTAAVVLVLGVALLHNENAMERLVANSYPTAACEFTVRNALPGPLFHEYGWGSYLVFALPEYAVALDSRADLYGDERNLEFMAAVNGRIPVDSLASFRNANTLMLRPQSQLAMAIGTRGDFVEAYRDDHAVVLLRRTRRGE